MRYRTKIMVVTGGREYEPGVLLPEDISYMDMAFLKSKGFVEPADTESVKIDYNMPEKDNDIFLGFRGKEPELLKSPDEILKIRSKKDMARYAVSIGFDLGNSYEERPLKDLQEEVIHFQKEKLEGDT